jgi:hypothetical protein
LKNTANASTTIIPEKISCDTPVCRITQNNAPDTPRNDNHATTPVDRRKINDDKIVKHIVTASTVSGWKYTRF